MAKTKLSQVQQNILRILKQSLDRAYARHVDRCRKRGMDPIYWGGSSSMPPVIDRLFATLATSGKVDSYKSLADKDVSSLLLMAVQYCYTSDEHRRKFEKDWVNDLRKHAVEYDLLAQLPPPKRRYERKKPLTLIERRAEEADEKVREWERKLALAKTKLAAYRKKQAYYAKKGVAAV